MYVSRTLPFVRGEIDQWWCWWWRVYLPTSRISAEIAKRRCKPSVDFVKSQLLLGGFSYCLEKRQSPVTLSRLQAGVCCSENEFWELFAFSKSLQSELGSLQEGLTLLSKLSLLYFWFNFREMATYDGVRRGCASMTRPSYIYTTNHICSTSS